MKKILIGCMLFASLTLSAQQSNTLLDQSFWKDSPTLKSVKAEVDKGNSPTEANERSMDVVTMAINNNAAADIVKFLLDQKGNDVNKITHEGRTYLHWATQKGDPEVVKLLIEKGANINLEDERGLSPLYYGLNNGLTNIAVIDLFFKAGLDPKAKYKEDQSTLMMVAIPTDKDLKITDYLISKGLSLSDTDKNGATVFDYAAKGGDIELMKALLKKGAKPTDNALLLAAQGTRRTSNTVDTYRFLIDDVKLNPNVLDKNGNNLLQLIASKQNQAEVAAYLISKGVDANNINKDGSNALMLAAGGNDSELVKLLVAKTNNINALDQNGESALIQAVKSGSAESMSLLIADKADVKILDAKGNNLVYFLVKFYKAPRGGFGGPGFGRGPQGGNPNQKGENREAGNPNGGWRGQQGQAGGQGFQGRPGGQSNQKDDFNDKLAILKANGIDVAAPQKDGNTLYHYAVAKGDLNLLKKIADLGIDINAINGEGMTALHKAALTSQNDEILKFLIAKGAKKDIKTDLDETAFDLASQNEYLKKNNVDITFLK